MTHKPFDLEKAMRNGGRCMTRDGHMATILKTDLHSDLPIAGFVTEEWGSEIVKQWATDGLCCGRENKYDLVNIPEKRTGWVVLYCRPDDAWGSYGFLFSTEEEAKAWCVHLDLRCGHRIVQLEPWED